MGWLDDWLETSPFGGWQGVPSVEFDPYSAIQPIDVTGEFKGDVSDIYAPYTSDRPEDMSYQDWDTQLQEGWNAAQAQGSQGAGGILDFFIPEASAAEPGEFDWLDIDWDTPEMKGDDPDWSSPTSMSSGDYATSLDQLWSSLFPEEGGDTGEFDWLDIDWDTPEMKGDDPDWSSPTSMSSEEYATYLDQLWPSLFPEETATGPLGGKIGPWLKNLFLGSGEGGGGGGILGTLLGGGGGAAGGGYQKDANGNLILDANGNPIPIGGGGGLGSLLGGDGGFGGPLMTFLAMKSLLKDQPEGTVPIGGEAYGGPAFNYQDYQPTNLKPALMPGVGYANRGAPGMRAGGRSDGPGDITFAKLEPGEFVIQKPVVDAVGIERLEQLNNMFGQ